jgi:hypothetical protein
LKPLMEPTQCLQGPCGPGSSIHGPDRSGSALFLKKVPSYTPFLAVSCYFSAFSLKADAKSRRESNACIMSSCTSSNSRALSSCIPRHKANKQHDRPTILSPQSPTHMQAHVAKLLQEVKYAAHLAAQPLGRCRIPECASSRAPQQYQMTVNSRQLCASKSALVVTCHSPQQLCVTHLPQYFLLRAKLASKDIQRKVRAFPNGAQPNFATVSGGILLLLLPTLTAQFRLMFPPRRVPTPCKGATRGLCSQQGESDTSGAHCQMLPLSSHIEYDPSTEPPEPSALRSDGTFACGTSIAQDLEEHFMRCEALCV